MSKFMIKMFLIMLMTGSVFLGHFISASAQTKEKKVIVKVIRAKAKPTQRVDSYPLKDVDTPSAEGLTKENRYHRDQNVNSVRVYKDVSSSNRRDNEELKVEYSEGHNDPKDVSTASSEDDSLRISGQTTSFSSFKESNQAHQSPAHGAPPISAKDALKDGPARVPPKTKKR